MRLLRIIQSKPEYIIGLQPKAVRERTDEAFKELISGVDWINSDIIHNASIKNKEEKQFDKLFEVLKRRDTILVSNVNLVEVISKFNDHSTSFRHIIIGEKDCWLEYEDILKALKKNITDDVVILYCASMASEVLIDDIYNEYGLKVTQIDIGSAFDPYCGKHTRTYHQHLGL